MSDKINTEGLKWVRVILVDGKGQLGESYDYDSLQDSIPVLKATIVNKSGKSVIPNTDNVEVKGSLGFDTFIVIGQSNAEGNGKPIDSLLDFTDSRCYQFSPGIYNYANTLYVATPKLVNVQGELDNTAIGFPLTFGKHYLAENPLKRVCFLGCALGNTGFSTNHWNPEGNLYNATVEVANRFLTLYPGSNIKGFLWHQGERDHDNSVDSELYRFYLERMINSLRSTIVDAANVPFITGNYSPNWALGSSRKAAYERVNFEVTRRINYTGNVLSTGLQGNIGDEIHFDSRSQRELGLRYYLQYKFALNNKLRIPNVITNFSYSVLSTGAILINFVQDNVADYSIVTVNNKSFKIDNIPFVVPNLLPNTEYSIEIKSINIQGESNKFKTNVSTGGSIVPIPSLSNALVYMDFNSPDNIGLNQGSINLGLINNITYFNDDYKGGTAKFVGDGGFINDTAISASFSFLSWIYFDDYRPSASIISLHNAATPAGELKLMVDSANPIRIVSNNVNFWIDNITFPLKQWVCIGFSYSSGVLTIYKNGIKVATNNITWINTSTRIWIGRLDWGFGDIVGKLNNVYLFNGKLNDNEMLKLYEISS